MADFPELCDQQNEENEKYWNEPPVLIKPYNPGQGPNRNFHDSGVGQLKRAIESDRIDEYKEEEIKHG